MAKMDAGDPAAGNTKIVPPLTSSLISLLKATAALSIIAVDDIMKMINRVNSTSFRTIELYTTGAAIYVAIGLSIGALAYLLEHHFTPKWSR
ncbi:MAG: hypothetical protein QM744_14890 [Mesorhizobium sp.]